MKFYNRKKEIAQLVGIQEKARRNAQFTVVTGRRRIGKTQLLLEATKNTAALYFFVARKSETLLCADFQKEISEKLNVPILGTVEHFSDIFTFIVELSKKKSFTLIIDELQDFYKVNASVFSDIQRIWDLNKEDSKLNLIVCGSIYSLMHTIFKNAKEPLFGRATHFIKVQSFTIETLQTILADFNAAYSSEDLLALYTFTGGVAKHVQLLMDNNKTTYKKMLNYILQEDAIFLSEGKNSIISEFGKDYATYFSVLSAIADGKTTRNEIEQLLQKEVGGYLTRLENDYGLITKKQPILSTSRTKNFRYQLIDNFLLFWFRFVYKYQHLIEIGNYTMLKQIVQRDYTTFSGFQLGRYLQKQLQESENYSRIGGFWDKKGENEIDVIAINEVSQTIDFYEVKRQARNISLSKLEEKAHYFLSQRKQLKSFKKQYKKFSLDDLKIIHVNSI